MNDDLLVSELIRELRHYAERDLKSGLAGLDLRGSRVVRERLTRSDALLSQLERALHLQLLNRIQEVKHAV